jgi:hypothetical protein
VNAIYWELLVTRVVIKCQAYANAKRTSKADGATNAEKIITVWMRAWKVARNATARSRAPLVPHVTK